MNYSPAEVAFWDQRSALWEEIHVQTCAATGHLTMNAWWAQFGIEPSDHPVHRFCHRCGQTL